MGTIVYHTFWYSLFNRQEMLVGSDLPSLEFRSSSKRGPLRSPEDGFWGVLIMDSMRRDHV